MRRPAILFAAMIGLFVVPGALAEELPAHPEFHAARRVGWTLAATVVESMEKGQVDPFPGIKAWLAEFRKATQGIDPKAEPAKWPAFDVDAVVTRNPLFWQAYYEIAPGDPGLAMMHAALLLLGGEGNRAVYVLAVSSQRPGVPAAIREGFGKILAANEALAKRPNELIGEGIKLHDAGDYDGALKKYRESLALWPQYGFTHFEIGMTKFYQHLKATGQKLPEPNSVQINPQGKLPPEVVEAYAKARRHDPFQIKAYQGDDQEVIAGFMELAKRGMSAWQQVARDWRKPVPNAVLATLADSCQAAGVHELAVTARQVLIARRGQYAPDDHPFLTKSLHKLAPGEPVDATLKKLTGKPFAVRQLVKPEADGGLAKNANFDVAQVVLYVRPQELNERLGGGVEPLVDFMKQVAAEAAAFWAGQPKGQGQSAMLIAVIKPEQKVRYWSTFETELKDEIANNLHKKFEKITPPPIKKTMAVAFQVKLWGGPEKLNPGPPPDSLLFPKEWRDVAEKKNFKLQVPLSDEALEAIWP